MATNFEPHECVTFVQSKKIGTHENKAIHSTPYLEDIVWIHHLLYRSQNFSDVM